MPLKTPFYDRLESLNETKIWKSWSGFLIAPKLQHSLATEYYSIRNSVSLLDTSPLFKYQFSGDSGLATLSRVLVRDPSRVGIGKAQYNLLCDEQGFVLQDCVLLRLSRDEFLMSVAEPSLRHFRGAARSADLDPQSVQDVSQNFGILALQGPHAFSVLRECASGLEDLGYFETRRTTIGGTTVVVSRTGYTGDLGFELWIPHGAALHVWDTLFAAGSGFNITAIGTTALKMARVEAGLLLLDVDFESSRFAWSDEQRSTPNDLGFGWMTKPLAAASTERSFIGRDAIVRELESNSTRWQTVGLEIDCGEYESLYRAAGVPVDRHNVYRESTLSLYRRGQKEWDYAGYASSFLYSSLLKRPIAIARLPVDLSSPGTEVDMEIAVIRKPETVTATVCEMPFFNPARKTAALS
ncbi:MAG: aminomethyltransferase family protein [Planctomycetota bacterium]